jgi:hypothetical protein
MGYSNEVQNFPTCHILARLKVPDLQAFQNEDFMIVMELNNFEMNSDGQSQNHSSA